MLPYRKISKILIANRGEIACRVIRTAHQLGIQCVAVYSTEDKNSLHVKLADEAWLLGAADSYLKAELIIQIAKKSGADAIHPGYGFLSENSQFAEQCAAEKIIFIGPPASAIKLMGSKDNAKTVMAKAKVPLLPGYHGEDQSQKTLQAEAQKIGYPLLIKANAGGGGKGMRIVNQADEFVDLLNACKRESLASFADDSVLLEKYLTNPRHIEIQIFADNHGNYLYLFERDCSIQRRHQKIIEEAPAVDFPQETREKMGEIAITAAKAIDYRGAGTVEFLLDEDGTFYFMEMNTRLQVEHPITEKITGLDLVEWQILVANNQALPLTQADLKINGHAIEARICAEDPGNNFLPATGKIKHLKLPELNQHIRVDSGVLCGDQISVYYDSMIAKLIVWDSNRDAALSRLKGALGDFHISGIQTNIHFLHQLVSSEAFIEADVSTQFLSKYGEELTQADDHLDDQTLVAAALFMMLKQSQKKPTDPADPYSPWQDSSGWRLNEDNYHLIELFYRQGKQLIPIEVIAHFNHHLKVNHQLKEKSFLFEISNKEFLASGYLHNDELHMALDGHQSVVHFAEVEKQLVLFKNATQWCFETERSANKQQQKQQDAKQQLVAPMPGIVTQLLVNQGDFVAKGEKILVMEAMKIEHSIKAHKDIVIKQLLYQVGDNVEESATLVLFEEEN